MTGFLFLKIMDEWKTARANHYQAGHQLLPVASILKTPRGMMYFVLTLLLLFSVMFQMTLFFGLLAAGFFVVRALQAFSEHFRCGKCLIGLGSAVCMVLTVVMGFSVQMFLITLVTMWADAWVHS